MQSIHANFLKKIWKTSFYRLQDFCLLLSTTGNNVDYSKQNKKDGDNTKLVTSFTYLKYEQTAKRYNSSLKN